MSVLGSKLTKYRVRASKTLRSAALDLNISAGELSLIERGLRGITLSSQGLDNFIKVYGLSKQEEVELKILADSTTIAAKKIDEREFVGSLPVFLPEGADIDLVHKGLRLILEEESKGGSILY